MTNITKRFPSNVSGKSPLISAMKWTSRILSTLKISAAEIIALVEYRLNREAMISKNQQWSAAQREVSKRLENLLEDSLKRMSQKAGSKISVTGVNFPSVFNA